MKAPDVHPANIRFLFRFRSDCFRYCPGYKGLNRFLLDGTLHNLGYHRWWAHADDRNQDISDLSHSVVMRVVPRSVVIRELGAGASPFSCERMFFPKGIK